MESIYGPYQENIRKPENQDGYLEYCNDKQCCPTRDQTIALQKNFANHRRAIKRKLTQLTQLAEASELNQETQKNRRPRKPAHQPTAARRNQARNRRLSGYSTNNMYNLGQ